LLSHRIKTPHFCRAGRLVIKSVPTCTVVISDNGFAFEAEEGNSPAPGMVGR
jgi:hypothetical protein